MSAAELAGLTVQQKTQIALRLRLPVDALDQLVPSDRQSLHFQNLCPVARSRPKGPHPQIYALLKDCAEGSISNTDAGQLEKLHIADQLRALCKHHVYEQFASAIDEIWSRLQLVFDEWRADTGSRLGTLQEVSSERGQPTMMLVPIGEKEKKALDGSPSLEALFVQLMHYTRNTWGAAIMQWSQQSAGRYDQYLPGYLTQTTDLVPFREDLLRGVNTAIKINYSINYLLLKLSQQVDSEKSWRALQQHNYSFAALWAAGSITTLASLTDKLAFYPDAETVDYLTRMKVIAPSSYSPGQPGFELLDPAYFCLREGPANRQSLDLAEERMPEIRDSAIQSDVIIKKCPALKIGVVKSMYEWICEIVTEAISSTARVPWRD